MVDILNEEVLSLTEATKVLPQVDGKRCHVSTVFRWCSQGCRGGIRLEHAYIGRRLVTSREALQRFAVKLAETPTPTPKRQSPAEPRERSDKQRTADLELATRRLRRRGMQI